MVENLPLIHRPRRLRMSARLRGSLAQVRVRRRDLIVPVFVCEGKGVRREIPSMPGIYQMSVDVAGDWLQQRAAAGFAAYLAFGVIDRAKKDPQGSVALDPDNVVCRLLREMAGRKCAMVGITDLCFCEYTSHGHCGILSEDRSTVINDATVNRLVEQAINHARAGAGIVAPSGMMDGAVGAIRRGLDLAGFVDVAILAYSVKYASAFYGPFRDAADSAPQFGDRRSYQMDPARGRREAIHEALTDIAEGADMVMVKPAMPYLDILAAVRRKVNVPLVAYQVSGEYSMLEAAARQGWLDRETAVLESLLAIKRAGADLIITYFSDLAEKLLPP
ncbi:MAG TPA: porphobilinogen synthase [Tepidisphaeraceae bacterium]|jgi:porphobilinogen synthase|nr:porphobilinogen synthase [Tepidisphaeraceae bacterium]